MPNAYLAMLYWDSEMFARNTRKRKILENKNRDDTDYRALCIDLLFKNTAKYNINHDTLSTISWWRRLFIKSDGIATNDHYQKMYESILYGDPKGRDRRSLITKIFGDYSKRT